MRPRLVVGCSEGRIHNTANVDGGPTLPFIILGFLATDPCLAPERAGLAPETVPWGLIAAGGDIDLISARANSALRLAEDAER